MVDFSKKLKEMRVNKANNAVVQEEAIAINRITLPSGKTITLNDQQAEALQTMKEWLLRKDDLFFTLSGFAGTGKTTITLELIKFFNDAFKWKRACVSAPTHKAQGSTFFYVAVSEKNLDTNKNHEERNKLKYVALSRPTRQAIVLTNKL